MEPIQTGEVNFKKCSLLDNKILIGIDCGCSLIKFVFLDKKNKDQLQDDTKDFVTINFAIFRPENAEDTFNWLKDRAYFPEDTKSCLHGTGVIFFKHRKYIESLFGVKSVHVNEGLSIVAGHKIGLENIPMDSLLHPKIEYELPQFSDNNMITKIVESMKKNLKSDDQTSDDPSSNFPCILYLCGSASSLFYFDKNGLAKQTGYVRNGGKTFLGMAKCLLDTNNYDEVMELARKGDRVRVDTQVKDVFNEDIKSPYGKFPPELPIFSFGKMAETSNNIEDFMKEDIAKSLIGYQSAFMRSTISNVCMNTKAKKIFLSGNLFKSSLFQEELLKSSKTFSVGIEYNTVNMGYGAALGAMFCDDDDRKYYMRS